MRISIVSVAIPMCWLLIAAGCSRSGDAELTKTRSEAEAVKVELAKVTAELNSLKARGSLIEELLPTGAWKMNANGVQGELMIVTIAGGKLEGTMLGSKMRGSYDQNTKQLSLERLNDQGSVEQFYTGEVFISTGKNHLKYYIAGTFHGDGGVGGSAEVEANWFAQILNSKR